MTGLSACSAGIGKDNLAVAMAEQSKSSIGEATLAALETKEQI